MAVTLSTGQADLANRSDHVLIPLIVFTGATSTYYWSTVGVHYDWNGAGDQYFRGVVSRISPIDQRMPHLTLGRGNEVGVDRLRLELVNEEIEGEALWKTLRTEIRPFKSVEVAVLLVDPKQFTDEGANAWWDLRDLDGDEHTYVFRGEVVDSEIVEDDHVFAINFETPEPELPLVQLLEEDTNDPKDFGSYLPVVYGAAKRVPCKNIDVGWETTLAEPLDPSATGARRVTDATGFATATTFDMLVGTEIIRCSGSDHSGNTVTITTRGYGSSNAVQHFSGEFVVELLDEVVVGLAGNKCGVIRQLFLESPYTGDLVRFLAPYSLSNEDTSAIPGSTISTARIEQDALVGVLTSMNANARVTVQPVHSYTGDTSPQSDSETPTDQTVQQEGYGSRGYFNDVDTTTPEWQFNPTYPRNRLKCEWTGSLDSTYEVLKWRVNVAVTITDADDVAGVSVYPYDISGFDGEAIECKRSGDGNAEATSGWVTPTESGTTMSDLVSDNSYLRVYGYINSYSAGNYATVHITTLEIEAELTATTSSVDREVDVEIEAGSVGSGLRFYADIDGYGVPYVFTEGYDYEDNESWSVTNCTSTRSTAQVSEGTYSRAVDATGAGDVATQITGLTSNKDLSTTDDRYRISLYAVNPSLLDMTEPIKIWFSNSSTGASGTSPPTERYEMQIDPALLVNTDWVHLEATAYDIAGSASVDDIDTIGMSFSVDSGSPLIYFDDLAVAGATNDDYDGAPGDLIENMPDIVRHFIAEHCGLGQTAIDDTSFDLALTRLDDNEYAGPVTVYGTRFNDVLAGLALEGRGNIVREEGSTGSLYKFHVAQYSSNIWPYSTASHTLTEWNRLTERSRSSKLCATQFRAFWKWDPFLGYGEDSFTKVTRADSVTNDTAIPTLTFTVAVVNLGQHEADPIILYLVRDEATAEDVLGFYGTEALAYDRVEWELVSPYCESFELQRGDIVSLTPSWEGSSQNGRVVEIELDPQSPVRRLTLVEVSVA